MHKCEVLPRIGVAIPSYNRKELLFDLLSSLPSTWSAYVSDNGSSLIPLNHPIPPNVYISHAQALIEVLANWNRALSLVGSECTHVFITSDDDLYLPSSSEIVQEALNKFPDADVFIFGCDHIDEVGRRQVGYRPSSFELLDNGDGFLKFINGVDARMPGILFRTDFIRHIGTFSETFKVTAADSEFIQRALLLGRAAFIPDVVGLYRIWPGSSTHAAQASDAWIAEVVEWTNIIGNLINSGHQPKAKMVDVALFRSEILARNIYAGAASLYRKGEYRQAMLFFSRHPLPNRYSVLFRLRVIILTLRLSIKRLLHFSCK